MPPLTFSLSLPSPAGIVTGIAGMVSGIICTQVGGLFQACQTILGTINAPQLGLFLLGMMCPFANTTVSGCGCLVASVAVRLFCLFIYVRL